MWTELEAAEKMDEVRRRACMGEPQTIAGEPPCVVMSLAVNERLKARVDAAGMPAQGEQPLQLDPP